MVKKYLNNHSFNLKTATKSFKEVKINVQKKKYILVIILWQYVFPKIKNKKTTFLFFLNLYVQDRYKYIGFV